MDITYTAGQEKFNYRVCAVMISGNKILAMHDERSPYFYLPGGRVKMGETAECAVIREVEEELGVTPKIVRPLWLNQGFFTEDVDGLNYHELCMIKANALRSMKESTFTHSSGCRLNACGMNIFIRYF